jgi:hypothetical protein
MALARHRLGLLLLPVDPELPRERLEQAWEVLAAEGWREGSRPGSLPALSSGGFLRAWLDVEDDVRFVANRLGGFRVRCPATGANLVPQFPRALEAWRSGGPRALGCTACVGTHALEALLYAPEAGFARGWIALEEVEDASPSEALLARLAALWGGVRVVARRG